MDQLTNRIIVDNMNRQCIYNNLGTIEECPIWLWIMIGVLIVSFIGFLVWVIKETWIW